ncbi:hypothetical protein EV421DRAFT_1734841 [Armillaria borealis]|uniref:Uncharacterized protein n=1 Tax=Armillaria borealis TaxID=47425 RepID=A0AA39MS66_9AGAR|nr:hypothetical protein EV421DRAFT_1734841 [Armillaria borealis]
MTSRFSKCVERRLHQTASLQALCAHQLGASASQYIIIAMSEILSSTRNENMHITSVIGKPPFVVMASYRVVAEAWQAMQKNTWLHHCVGQLNRMIKILQWEEGAAANRLSTHEPPTPTQCYAFLIMDLSGYSRLEARIFHDKGKKLHYRASRHYQYCSAIFGHPNYVGAGTSVLLQILCTSKQIVAASFPICSKCGHGSRKMGSRSYEADFTEACWRNKLAVLDGTSCWAQCIRWVIRGPTTRVKSRCALYTGTIVNYCYVKAVLTATSWRRSSQLGLIVILLRRIWEMAETQGSDHANTAQVGVRFSMKMDLKCRIFLRVAAAPLSTSAL